LWLLPCCARKLIWCSLFLVGLVTVGQFSPSWVLAIEGLTYRQRVVTLDPGHGGSDTGARLPESGYEKDMTLAFALALKDRLKGGHTVFLTREDDYAVEQAHRVGMANHRQSDLLISVHMAPRTGSRPMEIKLYYSETVDLEGSTPGGQGLTVPSSEPGRWDTARDKSVSRSRAFIKMVEKRLADMNPPVPTSVYGCPLLLAAGANMPVVVVELAVDLAVVSAGRNDRNIERAAGAISAAVTDFFDSAR